MEITITEAGLREKYKCVANEMNERMRRHWAAAEAMALPYGGISLVAAATGLSRTTITTGIRELQDSSYQATLDASGNRVRRLGAGRPAIQQSDPTLLRDLELLVDPVTRGDPMSPLRWTCKSTRQLAKALREKGHQVCHKTIATLLHDLDYSLQGNRKTLEGRSHPDRNAQFEFINTRVLAFQRQDQPVVSVDTKKKENIGKYKNNGREWRPEGEAEKVNAKDFPDKQAGKAIPYGVYDLTCNNGWVSVGISHDTSLFAVESIRRWWQEMGRSSYPKSKRLLITADGGGSNGTRNRLWKFALQEFVNDTGLTVSASHFPPGTSKWNKIEHRMFCHITKNWRSRPLTSRAVVVNLIANTTTEKGLVIQAALDEDFYQLGLKVSDSDLAGINIRRESFHGDWNYSILPNT